MEDELPTRGVSVIPQANVLFDRVVKAMGIDDILARHVLANTIKICGGMPTKVTVRQLQKMTLELDRRLRLIIPPAAADAAMGRVKTLLFSELSPEQDV